MLKKYVYHVSSYELLLNVLKYLLVGISGVKPNLI
jgi:hypothetical protein